MPKNRYFDTFRLENLEIVMRWLKTDNGIVFGIEKSSGVHIVNAIKLVLPSYLSLKMSNNRYLGTFRLGNLEIVT